MQVQSDCRVCPVCKAGIEQDKVRSFLDFEVSTSFNRARSMLLAYEEAKFHSNVCLHGSEGDTNLRTRR